MTQAPKTGSGAPVTAFEAEWHQRLDALVGGWASLSEFLDQLTPPSLRDPDAAAVLLALVDVRLRRGQLGDDQCRSIEARVAALSAEARGAVDTSELDPPAGPLGMTVPSGASAELLPGSILRDRYVIESRVGRGGMGTVYKAIDRFRCDLAPQEQYVAIKVLHENVLDRPEVLAKLRREFYSVQALSHDQVVRVFELDQDDGVAFFTMELVEGTPLSDVVDRYHAPPLPRAQAWTLIEAVGAGLVHAHARNVVHADLKPRNIMVTATGAIRILDFGNACRTSAGFPRAGSPHPGRSVTMTPAYASCELLAGHAADASDDLFAFACLSYQLLTGEHPFQYRRADDARKAGIQPRRPDGLSRLQWRTLERGLAWERGGRAMPVQEWLAQLRPAAAAWTALPRPMRLAAMFAVLTVSLASWAAIHWPSAWNVAVAQSLAPVSPPASEAPPPGALPPATARAAIPPPVQTGTRVALQQRRGRLAVPMSADARRIGMARRAYRVRSGEQFVAIQVWRARLTEDLGGFSWWTEPDSAYPNVDYVSQAPTTHFFLKGSLTATVFVKVMPNASRKRAKVFFVTIGNPQAPGSIAQSAIVLPPLG